MLFVKRLLPVLLLAVISAMAQDGGSASIAATPDTSSKPVARPKSFDQTAMDKTVNPCEDFYQYACGNWRKNNPIPGDQSRWGRFNELAEYNRQILHDILEKDSHAKGKRTPVEQKVGDLYGSCMDEEIGRASCRERV